jgi:DNA-binding NarL/FixJ family response regulator
MTTAPDATTRSRTRGRRTDFAPELRRRQRERDAIDRHLSAAEAGRGSVLLIEGGAGVGKSRLLDEAVACADIGGFRVGRAVASSRERVLAMAPLLAALFDGAEPLLERAALPDLVSREPSFWSVSRLAAELGRIAVRPPILLCIDDLHAADQETAAALGILTQRLAGLPVQWILSYRPHSASRAVSDLVALLERHGAERLILEPLDSAATRLLTAELAGAEPSAELLEVASLAAGVPAAVVDLVRGLLEEGRLRVERGRADLVGWQIPRRIGDSVRATVARTSPQARSVATVAAVLGSPVALPGVASMLNAAPASLLAPIEELVQAEVLVDDGGSLTFRSELVRLGVSDQIAPSIGHALRLQAIDVLLEAGASPLQPARELIGLAGPGDRRVVDTLAAAARALGVIDPQLATQLCRHAFAVTTVGDGRRPTLAADLATFLHDAGRGDEGRDVIATMRRESLRPDDEAMLRLAEVRMVDLAPEIRVEIGEAALAISGVSAPWQAAHAAELILNQIDSGRLDLAAAKLPPADAVASDEESVTTPLTGLARVRLTAARGEFERARAELEAIVSAPGLKPESLLCRLSLWHAELLLSLDDHESLQPRLQAAVDTAERTGQVALARSWRRIHGRLLLRRGQLAEANGLLEEELAGAVSAVTPDDAERLLTLGELAIHTGDNRTTKVLAAVAERTGATAGLAARRLAVWLLACQADASNDAARVRERLAELGPVEQVARLPTLLLKPLAAPRLVRMALRVGLRDVARATAAMAGDLAARNLDAPAVAAAAAHCRGLVDQDPDALARAAEILGTTSLVISHASALEDLGAELARRSDGESAVAAFDCALRRYALSGANWDAARVRRRLRKMGVRRRIVASTRPTSGWQGLTAAELDVVRLVTHGLTNRDVARRLFVSKHTVSMHLRHVFWKLGINSRVELTRMALDEQLV